MTTLAIGALTASALLGGPLPGSEPDETPNPRVRPPVGMRRSGPTQLAPRPRFDSFEPLPTENDPWWTQERAFADSMRPRLEDKGISIELVSTDEAFSKRSGGLTKDNATEYRGNVDLTFTFDLEKMGLPEGAHLFLYAQNGHGTGLTDDYVGDLQAISNIDAEDFTQISEYWYEQSLADGGLRFKVGKQDGNADFAAVDLGVDFINASFGLIPTVPVPTFPDPALGIAGFSELADWLSIGAGIYDGAPDGGESGFSSAFDGEGGAFSVVELAVRPFAAVGPAAAYRFGAWYHSDEVAEIASPSGPAPAMKDGNYGFYVGIDQRVFSERGSEDEGLGVFAQLGTAPDDRNEAPTGYVGGGLSYTGLVPGRDEDVVGLGVARARLGDPVQALDGRTRETAFEIFYKAQVLPWLSVQPDIQYIVNPGGDGEDALAVGLRLETAL